MIRIEAVGLMATLIVAAPGAWAANGEGRQGSEVPPLEKLGAGRDCTWARTIDDWEAVDRHHIILRGFGGNGERYLVRFAGTCLANPKFEVSIGVYSRDNRLCPYGGDALILDGERCTILDMWELPRQGARQAQDKPDGNPPDAPSR